MAGLTFNIMGHDVSASSALRGVEGQASQTGNRISGTFKRVGASIAGAFAAVGVVSFFKDSIQGYQDHLTVLKQTEQVVKTTGGAAKVTADQVGALSDSIEAKTGVDGDAVLSGENMLLTFTNIRNEVGKGNDIFSQATQITTDMSVALGTDLKGQAIQVGKALNDPIKGVSALSKVGVSFTDQQKEQIKTLVESGNTLGAQKVILRELGKEFGGTAAKVETPTQKMMVGFHGLQDSIGQMLLPVMVKLMSFVTAHVIPGIQTAINWVQQHKKGFEELGRALMAVAVGVYKNVVQPVINALIPVIKAIIGWVQQHKEGIKQLGTVLATILVVAVRTVIGVLQVLITIIKAVVSVLQWAWGYIKPTAAAIGTAFRAIGTGLSWAWKNVLYPVFHGINAGVNGVLKFVKPVISSVSNAFKGIGNGLKWAWDHTFGPVFGWIADKVNWILDMISQITGKGHANFGNVDNIVHPTQKSGATRSMNAQGTGFFRGGLSLVGENGPEIVRMPRGAQVSTNSTSMSAMRGGGGGVTVVNVNIAGHALASKAEIGRTVVAALEEVGARGTKMNIGKAIR